MDRRTDSIDKARRALAWLWLGLFAVVYFSLAARVTMIDNDFVKIVIPGMARDAFIFIALLSAALEYAANRGAGAKKALGVLAFKLAVIAGAYYVAIKNVSNSNSWLLLLFAISAERQREDRVLKTGFAIGTAVVAAMFFLSAVGLVENNRNDAFGFIYNTHYACFLLCLALSYAIIRDGRFSWLSELGLVALMVLDLLFVHGKTCFACLFILIVGSFGRHYRALGATPFQDRARYGVVIPAIFRVLYAPFALWDKMARRKKGADAGQPGRAAAFGIWVMKYSFLICCGAMLLLTLSYRYLMPLWERVPWVGSIKARLFLGSFAFEEFPLTLWGSTIPQMGNSLSEHAVTFYYALDSAYVKVLQQFGVVVFALILALLTLAQARLIRRKRYYAAFVLSIFALDCTMEYWIFQMCYDVFILLSFCILKDPTPADAPESPSRWARLQTKGAFRAALALALCVLALWSATAFTITGWRGWTPDYGATVVVPGDYIDGVKDARLPEQRTLWAGIYMTAHEDAACIVGDAAQKDALVAMGLSPERISVDGESDSIDAMLLNADAMIREKALPRRLTVCTYAMQQALIYRHAKKLRVPVNSLTMNVPKGLYLRSFASEQWKILCGR